MPRRMLAGRPRLLTLLAGCLLASLSLLAANVGRPTGAGPIRALDASASTPAVAEFDDVPTTAKSPRATDPPAPGPVSGAPSTAPSAPAAEPDRSAGTAAPVPVAAAQAPPAPAPPAPAPPAPVSPAPATPIIPVGKGMWLYQLSMAEGGDAAKVARKASAAGLTHLYLRLGSSKGGFYGGPELDRLLPAAHAAGLKVVGWDFVYLFDPAADAARAKAEIDYATPGGHRIDAFSADIETASEGVNLTAAGAAAYGAALRSLAGVRYPLIATVPRPSAKRPFPYAEATASFDAIAPMVYWMNRDPATDVAGALDALAPLHKPVIPIGQAYDGGPEGGPKGDPPKEAVRAFMDTALARGAVGVSFWVWNHATPEQWSAIDGTTAWELPAGRPLRGGSAVYLQRVLGLLGHPVAADGMIGPATKAAITAVQVRFGLPGTGQLTAATVRHITGPRPS